MNEQHLQLVKGSLPQKRQGEVPDVTTYYMYLKEAEELGIINKMTASDTNKQWIELTDEGMLPF